MTDYSGTLLQCVNEHLEVTVQFAGHTEKITQAVLHVDEEISNITEVVSKVENKIHQGAGLVPKADNKCTGCGLCAKQCLAQAIEKENLKKTDSKKCISCMRCVVRCPQSARKVNGAMVSIASLALKKACSIRKENELYI